MTRPFPRASWLLLLAALSGAARADEPTLVRVTYRSAETVSSVPRVLVSVSAQELHVQEESAVWPDRIRPD